MDEYIPTYNTLYHQLSGLVQKFAERIKQKTHTDIDPFVHEIVQYIDMHYTDYDLRLTTLTSRSYRFFL